MKKYLKYKSVLFIFFCSLLTQVSFAFGASHKKIMHKEDSIEVLKILDEKTPLIPDLAKIVASYFYNYYVSVSVSPCGGSNFSCGLKADGSISCWGDDLYGPTHVPAGTYTQVSAGCNHACGLRMDGSISCWGNNWHGQTHVPTGTYTQVSAGVGYACGLKTDGSISCWGDNFYYRTHDGPPGTYTQVSVGANSICGLRTDGSLSCWGYSFGQSHILAGTYTQVSAGCNHACGLRMDGSISCWGVGYIIKQPRWFEYRWSDAVVPSGTSYTQVSTNNAVTCGLKTDGSISCSRIDGKALVLPGAYTQVSVGGSEDSGSRICGVKTDGTILCRTEGLFGPRYSTYGIEY